MMKRYIILPFFSLVCFLNGNAQDNHIRTFTATEEHATESSLTGATKEARQITTQYFDGLGRPIQVVSRESSPDGFDVVQHIDYDDFGRETIKFLPYVSGDANGALKTNPLTSLTNFYNNPSTKVAIDAAPWAVTIPEASPLSRPLQQGAPGTAWQPGTGAYISFDYSTNKEREVLEWQIQPDGTLRCAGNFYYDPGTLYKNTTIDEEGNEIVEYTDLEGKVILKKVQVKDNADDVHHEDWACTYYVYDDFNNLKYVLPPELIHMLTNTAMTEYETTGGNVITADVALEEEDKASKHFYMPWVTVTMPPEITFEEGFEISPLLYEVNQSMLDRWAFQYDYDERQRMIAKKLPGEMVDWVYMIYDQRDRLVLTQDGNQRQNDEWLFTKYDVLNRPIMTGIYVDSRPVDDIRDDVKALTIFHETFDDTETLGYTSESFPTTYEEAYTVTFYDNYDFTGLTEFGTAYEFGGDHEIFTEPQETATRGLITGSMTKNLETGEWIKTASYYDKKYRVIRSIKLNHLGGIDRAYSNYDFVGNVTETQIQHSDGTTTTEINERFDYDHAERLVYAEHQVNSEPWVRLSENEYNELGELVDKKLHYSPPSGGAGGGFLQSVDYKYNIRGWLTNINNSNLTDPYGETNTDQVDYFGMELGYNIGLGLTNQATYSNGNISAIKWSSFTPADTASERAYAYTYDRLNRIKTANHFEKELAWDAGSDKLKVDNINYDYNGNILSLTRNKADGTGLDEMTYDYGDDLIRSNQLLSVTDDGDVDKGFKDGNTTGNDYLYDANGNLTEDKNKEITGIEYNYLNLPRLINLTNGRWIRYYYDAAGIKLKKVVFDGMEEKTTDYVGNFIYENEKPEIILHAEGRIYVKKDAGGTVTGYEYQYHLKDHLGNTRVSFTSEPEEEEYIATMETENAAYEENYFHEIQRTADGLLNSLNVTPGGDEVMVLNSSQSIGANFFMEVMPGDEIDLSVYATYEAGDYANTLGQSVLINAIAAAYTGVSVFTDAQIALDAVNEAVAALPFGGSTNSSKPAAYLTYYVFDKNLDFEFGGFIDAISSDPMSMEQFAITDLIEIEKPGYILAFLSNESNSTARAIFDEFTVTLRRPIIQTDDYYPFGLVVKETQYQNPVALENKYLYNGKELQSDEFGGGVGLDWYDYGARMYDNEIGRYFNSDLLVDIQSNYTPYHYVYNNPISYIDPTGMYPDRGSNYIASTFVDKDGKIVEHKDDGDPLVYLVGDDWDGESKNGLSIIGFEEPGKKYKKGDIYEYYYFGISDDEDKNKKEEALAFAATATAVLWADDVTGYGVADDVLIPLIYAGTAIYIIVNLEDDAIPIAYPYAGARTKEKKDDVIIIYIDGGSAPEAAQHAWDAIISGVQNTGVLDRAGKNVRRAQNLRGISTVSGKDRDEFPPAVVKPDGRVSVRIISRADNRNAGNQIRWQITPYKDGTRVIVIPINVPDRF